MRRGTIVAAVAASCVMAGEAVGEARKSPLQEVAAIACSLLCREGRVEVAAGGGVGFADPTVNRREANVRLAYWPLDEIGIGIEGAIATVDGSDVTAPYRRVVAVDE